MCSYTQSNRTAIHLMVFPVNSSWVMAHKVNIRFTKLFVHLYSINCIAIEIAVYTYH